MSISSASRTRWTATAGIAGALLALGCSKGPVCKELGSCGGNLVGTWVQKPAAEAGANYCQEVLHQPPLEEYRLGQPTPVARTRVPESTNLDWCYNLILTKDDVNPLKKHFYYWENLVYVGGIIDYTNDGRYTLDLGRLGRMYAYYSRTCLSQYGHEYDCGKFQSILEAANQGAGEYHDFQCAEDTKRGGCGCSFSVSEADAQGGLFSVEGSTLTHFPTSTNTHFTQAITCVNGDTLQLSGKDNSYLWDRPGLRTMEFLRVNCEDGRQGPGEMGVDCGGACTMACAGGASSAP